MKKAIACFMAILMACSFSACGLENASSEIASSKTAAESKEKETAEKKKASTSKSQSTKKANSKAAKTAEKHQHKYTAKKTAATCQKKGYTTYTCACGDSYVDNYTTGSHSYANNKCKYCGKVNIDGLYESLKSWVIKNGTVNGDYISFSTSSDVYGGYSNENFSLTYWNDSEQLEFCLHSPLDETYSHNFFIYIPKSYNGNYEYISSYYYRDNGESKYQSKGVIEATKFTKNYPLKSNSYYGSAEKQNSFLEESRIGICDALSCLKQFLEKENTGYTLADLGFTKFS